MNWFFSATRIAGSAFPVSSMLVQFQAELDVEKVNNRLHKLVNPISALHDDINDISDLIYNEIKRSDDLFIEFDRDVYRKFSRVLAVLEKSSFIKGFHTIGSERFAKGLTITDPTYVLYLSALFENEKKMEIIFKTVDSCDIGQTLKGKQIKEEVGVPLPVIKAVFDIFEEKGYGTCSKAIGSAVYIGTA